MLQVEQVTRAVSAVASADSFLPMPQHSPVEDEYLRTHPSGENRCCASALSLLWGEGGVAYIRPRRSGFGREQELHAHLQECHAYRANWERLFKDRLCYRRGKRRTHLMCLRTGLSALRRANEWSMSPRRRRLLQRLSLDPITRQWAMRHALCRGS